MTSVTAVGNFLSYICIHLVYKKNKAVYLKEWLTVSERAVYDRIGGL